MNKIVVNEIFEEKLNSLKEFTYDYLCKYLTETENKIVIGSDGKEYQVETLAFWDDKQNEVLRLWISIDDMGWRAFIPMNRCFLIDKDKEIIDV